MPAARDNTGKPDLVQMLDFGTALDDVVAVLDQGAIKYEPGNWLLGGKPDSEYLSAAMRHIGKHRRGQVYDPETGVKHLASAAWNLLAALGLNYGAFPSIDPNFDQEAYVAKHTTPPAPPLSAFIEEHQRRVRPYGREYYVDKLIHPSGLWEVELLPWPSDSRSLWISLPEDEIMCDPILDGAD